jgi:hypothetical protein
VIFVGLAIALVAAKELFGFDVPEKRFLQLWVIIAATFNTWVFLAGIPQDLNLLNENREYPNGLKIFTQYILLPLIGLYLFILYAYELKIIITWNWPKGWVSQLVLWFSIVGIFSMLLLWPLRELTENRWIRTFTKWFFRALIPLVVMLFLAILERVGVYGITINRYLVLAMAIGLAILTLYFVFGQKKDIRAIPIIAFLIALLAAYGPWSAFAISQHSQQARLGRLLTKNGILVNNKIIPASAELSADNRGELSSVISYLAQWHGVGSFSPWLSDSTINFLKTSDKKWSIPDSISKIMGFEYIKHPRGEKRADGYFFFSSNDSTAMNISGYDNFIVFATNSPDSLNSTRSYIIESDTCLMWLSKHPPVFKLAIRPKSDSATILAQVSLSDKAKTLMETNENGKIPNDLLTFDLPIGDFSSRIMIDKISGSIRSDSVTIHSISAYVLLRKNK